MADSLLDLGSTPVFPLEPNWATEPSTNLTMTRRLLGYRGTIQSLFSLTPDVPVVFQAKFTVYDKTDENTIMDFFHARKGRNQRFWIKHPRQHFTLKETAGNGTLSMVCNPNDSHNQWQGYERIYIRMTDGDLLTRKVTAANYNEAQDEVTLTLNSALDRDITTTNQNLIGRMLLCRFDSDDFRVTWLTTITMEFSLKFYELVGEYSEA